MKAHGFTLIECLLYLMIFSVFVTSLVVLLSNQAYHMRLYEQDFITLRDRQFVFDKIEWLLQTADSVVVIDSATLEVSIAGESLQLVSNNERLFLLSLHRAPEPISPTRLTVGSWQVREEYLGVDRRIVINYRIQGESVTQVVYVPL
ncbi:MAG: hypothetical protein RLZZ360_849 [Candidatus Parcubacteria bacterium]|jgi:hypothetical protein